jgi:chorismate mutase/prephenate dehydratase
MSLEKLRQDIDKVDIQIVKLLNKRVRLSQQIFEVKNKLHLSIYDQQREEKVIENVIRQNKGLLTPQQVESIFQVIIDTCRITQQNQKGMKNGNRYEE